MGCETVSTVSNNQNFGNSFPWSKGLCLDAFLWMPFLQNKQKIFKQKKMQSIFSCKMIYCVYVCTGRHQIWSSVWQICNLITKSCRRKFVNWSRRWKAWKTPTRNSLRKMKSSKHNLKCTDLYYVLSHLSSSLSSETSNLIIIIYITCLNTLLLSLPILILQRAAVITEGEDA